MVRLFVACVKQLFHYLLIAVVAGNKAQVVGN